MSRVLTMWSTLSPLPLGARVFSFAFSRTAPYFASVRPRFTVVGPNRVELVVPKRRSVQNHLGTVHAIALCNGLEAAMGALAEVSIRDEERWIPKGMEVAYTAKATSDVTCVAETDPADWAPDRSADGPAGPAGRDVAVRVCGVRDDGTVVIEGVIRLWVTPRKRAAEAAAV